MDLAYLEKRVAELEQMKNQLSANANVVLGQYGEALNMLKLAKEAAAVSDAEASATPAAEVVEAVVAAQPVAENAVDPESAAVME